MSASEVDELAAVMLAEAAHGDQGHGQEEPESAPDELEQDRPVVRNGAHRDRSRVERCWQMRVHGLSQAEIAGRLGISQPAVSKMLASVRESFPLRTREELVAIAEDRYGELIGAFLPRAAGGDVAAARMVLQIERERRKLLGLDAPTRIEHSGTIGVDGPQGLASADPALGAAVIIDHQGNASYNQG